ncbi:MAG: hypothetical protein ACREP6_16180 [Candidatus Binataceae bacterium]
MAGKGIYDTVKQAIQDVVAPQMQELKGEISGMRGEMRQIEKRMEEGFAAVRSELHSEIGAVRSEIGAVHNEIASVRKELGSEIGSVRIEIASVRKELGSEIASLRSELTSEIGSLRSELRSEIGAVRSEVVALRSDLVTRIDFTNKRLDEALEVRERLAALEARVGAHG